MIDKIQKLADKLEKQTVEMYHKEYPGTPENCIEQNSKVKIKMGKKYCKVDVGTSGRYMIDTEGNIYGIKAYGVIHKGHQYGTLDTIDNYYWGGYTARKIA